MSYDLKNDLGLKPRGEARKHVPVGAACPHDGCDGTMQHSHDKDEGAFAFRVTKCDVCEDWWKFPVPA